MQDSWDKSINFLKMSVEVERKFLCNADTRKALEQIGVCVGQRQFQDQYFDTPMFDLTLRNMWLRKRNKECWELKCEAVDGTEEMSRQQTRAVSMCTQYKEITSLHEIQLRLKEVLKTNSDCEANSLQEDECWLGEMNLVPFAEFITERWSYTLEEDGVQVDLDRADFGYSVGEIEVLVPEGGNVKSALEKIERTAQKLGLTGNQRVDGKMNVYLQRNHPEHYAKLLSNNII
ncbi:thiamine-triphosphatase isoform X2 [Antennarius striatus]|uniref:thiamine-triphosphatase isoform X2 n=1 Tax=Antennarius striatus TaxID=241820 RepID=UPI0035B174D8